MGSSSSAQTSRASGVGHLWPVAGLAAAIAVGVQFWGLYRVTGPPSPPWFPYADKVEHLTGFAFPVALILLTVGWRGAMRGRRLTRSVWVTVIGVFAAHAVVSELIQHFWYPTRSGDPRDALADGLGIALGALVAYAVLRWSQRTGSGD